MDDQTYAAAAEAAMPGMFRMAYSILENRHDAEDAVQQALLNAWQHREKARPGAERAWMMRIVINASYDLCRKRRRAVPVAEVPEERASSGDGEYAALLEEYMSQQKDGFNTDVIDGYTGFIFKNRYC